MDRKVVAFDASRAPQNPSENRCGVVLDFKKPNEGSGTRVVGRISPFDFRDYQVRLFEDPENGNPVFAFFPPGHRKLNEDQFRSLLMEINTGLEIFGYKITNAFEVLGSGLTYYVINVTPTTESDFFLQDAKVYVLKVLDNLMSEIIEGLPEN